MVSNLVILINFIPVLNFEYFLSRYLFILVKYITIHSGTFIQICLILFKNYKNYDQLISSPQNLLSFIKLRLQYKKSLKLLQQMSTSNKQINKEVYSISKLQKNTLQANHSPFQQSKKQSKLNFKILKNLQNVSSSRISKLSDVSTRIDSNKFNIKLPNSFYNDSKSIYLEKSRTMSQKSMCYQVWPMSFSQRKKLQQSKLQAIVDRRKTQISQEQVLDSSIINGSFIKKQTVCRSKSSINLKNLTARDSNSSTVHHQKSLQQRFSRTQRKFCQDRFKSHNSQKYTKLIYGAKLKQVQQKMLRKDITRISSQKVIAKNWQSPFKNNNLLRQKFQGKPLTSKSVFAPSQRDRNSAQLKVLNIDRLFRKKDGKLTNVVPLPVVKLQSVNCRKNMTNLVKNQKKKDSIQGIIEDFNQLLRIGKLKKASSGSKILGIKGKNFTKNPTFEELMGLKIKPRKHIYHQQSEQVSKDVFFQYCEAYKQIIDQNFELKENFVSGLRQMSQKFSLEVLTRFYCIFVNNTATIGQKVQFFKFFLIPLGKELIYKSQIVEMLRLLCKGNNLPYIGMNVKTQTLSAQQKSLIFLQALIRVLFGQLFQEEAINRQELNKILIQNEEAVELLLKIIKRNN